MAHIRTTFHLIAVAHFSYGLYYDAFYFKMPLDEQFKQFHIYGGRLKFLTIWNMLLQAAFFWICLINDIAGSNDVNPRPKPKIRATKDFLFASLAFPLSAFVAITFWAIYAVDRELILPRALDLYFPTWLNHIMHTNILIFSLVEMVCSFRVYPKRKNGLGFLTGVMLIYLIWTFVIYVKSGHWVYPIMEVLNWPMRIGFFVTLLAFILALYVMGELLNNLIWGSEVRLVESTPSGRKPLRKKTK